MRAAITFHAPGRGLTGQVRSAARTRGNEFRSATSHEKTKLVSSILACPIQKFGKLQQLHSLHSQQLYKTVRALEGFGAGLVC